MTRICERLFLLLLTLITLLTVVNAQTQQDTPPPQSYLPANAVAWFYGIGALASALASVVAWFAKIKWGQELEAIYKERIANLQQEKESLEQNRKDTIGILERQIGYQEVLHKERLDTIKEAKDVETATWKAFSSPDIMNTFKARTEMLNQIIQERDKEIEKLHQQVDEHPLDAEDFALRKEKLELEKDFFAKMEAYEMKMSGRRFSDKAVSGKDEGKIQSAISFLDRLGATEAGFSQRHTEEETTVEHPNGEGARREAPANT